MTQEESDQIAFLGTVFFVNVFGLIFASGFFGFYILAFMMSIHIILQKENTGRGHKALIGLLLAGFLITALATSAINATKPVFVKHQQNLGELWIAMDCCGLLWVAVQHCTEAPIQSTEATELSSSVQRGTLLWDHPGSADESGLVTSLPGGLMTQEMAANLELSVIEILDDWSANISFLIADIAIVWRAWVLWGENQLMRWMILIMLLLDIGIGIADSVSDTKATINLNNNAVTLDSLSTALNLAVNIVETLLIAYRAWTHHQSTRAISRNKKTQVEAILLLMVESGAIFGVVQVTYIISSALDIHAAGLSPINIANSFLEALYLYSAALNPVALVILIQTGNTYEHSFHLEDVTSLEINSVPIVG